MTLQGGPGKDGLDGLPGADGAKVNQVSYMFYLIGCKACDTMFTPSWCIKTLHSFNVSWVTDKVMSVTQCLLAIKLVIITCQERLYQ